MLRNLSRKRKSNHSYQTLENRRLLAGDVTLFQRGDVAYLRGDRADNQIEIVANDDGEVVVRGINGTEVNNQSEVVLNSSNSAIGALGIHLGQGDDSLFVEGIEIERYAVVRGGTGDDAIGFYQVETGDDLVVQTWSGNDSISLDEVTVGDRLVTYSFGGDDTIGIDHSTIHGTTLISTHGGDDRVAVTNSNHNGSVFAFTGSGNDFASFESVRVGGFSALLTQDGNDEVVLENTTFDRTLFANGGRGFDSLDNLGGNEFSRFSFIRSFEGNDVADETERRDQVFSDLILSGARLGTIAELATLTPELSTLLFALQETGLDAAVADKTASLTVFAPLNSAFDALGDTVGELLEGNANGDPTLSNILKFHVAPEVIFASDLVSRSSVATLFEDNAFSVEIIDGEVKLNGGATLAVTDIRAKNGVVHLLNDVLLPGGNSHQPDA